MNLLRRRMFSEQNKVITLELKNITENASWINGIYIDDVNGSEVPYNTWKASDYIPVEFADYIFISRNNSSAAYNCFYDRDKRFVKNINISGGFDGLILKVPEDACYVRFSNAINGKAIEAYGVKGK